MSKVSQFNNKEKIQEQACLWISRLDRGLSHDEEAQLTAWVHKRESHHTALLKMASYWDNLTVLNELSALFPLDEINKKPIKRLKMFAVAASFVFMSLFASVLVSNQWFPFAGQHQAQTFSTNVGEQNTFALSDGSTILLNTNSVLEIAFTSTHRQLTLLRGEVSFDVAKDATRPFTVTAGNQSFTALGTVFNVQKNDEKTMELVVTEGRVLISDADVPLQQITTQLSELNSKELNGIIVTSGEKAVIEPQIKRPVMKVPLEQLQRDLAWQQGILIFEGEPLSQALLEVSRYTDTQFEIADPQLANLKVAGYFKAGDIDGLISSLNSNFNIVATHPNNYTVILSASTP